MSGKRADLCLLLIAVIWGATFVITKNALAFSSPLTFLSLRFLIGTVSFAILFRDCWRGYSTEVFYGGVIIGIFLFLALVFQMYALQYTTATNVAFLTGLSCVFVPLFLTLFFRKNLRKNILFGGIFAAIGIFFLCGGKSSAWNPGDRLALISAVFYAAHILSIDKYTKKQNETLIAFIELATCTMLSLIAMMVSGEKGVTAESSLFFALFYTGVLGTAISFGGQTVLQKRTTPTRAAIMLATEPAFGALFAGLIPNSMGQTETFTIEKVIGCMFLLFGIFLSESRAFSKKRRFFS